MDKEKPIVQFPKDELQKILNDPRRFEHVFGQYITSSLVPTDVPKTPQDQIRIYKSGSTVRLYFYDKTNGAWNFVASGGEVAGSNTEIQFNDNGVFGGDDDLTWDKTNHRLTIGNVGGEAEIKARAGTLTLYIIGGSDQLVLQGNVVLTGSQIGANSEVFTFPAETGTIAVTSAESEFIEVHLADLGTQFDKTNTTLATVMSSDVSAGKIYHFEADLFVNADTVGGSKFAMGGTCTATAIVYEVILIDNSTSALTITSRQTALGGSVGQAGTTAGFCKIRGTISVNAGGTLTVQFAQNAANGTSSVLVGSAFFTKCSAP